MAPGRPVRCQNAHVTIHKLDSTNAFIVFDLDESEAAWETFEAEDEGCGYLTALGECLELLKGRAQETISLRYKDGWSRARIAARLGIGEQGVKSILRRTRLILRGCVEGKIGS